jgi:hypothetical protein
MSSVHNNIRNWHDMFEALALDLGVEVEALHAVAAAEVGSLPTPPIGLPVIRFEVHSTLRMTKVDMSARIELRDAPTAWHKDAHWYKSSKTEDWEHVHSGDQSDEWGALAAAARFDPETAFKCTSWGVGQLMGWHHKTCGYSTVQEMVSDAMLGPSMQFKMWGAFFKNEKGGVLVDSMTAHNWKAFARVYNGPGQVDYYGEQIAKHYQRAKDALASGLGQEEAYDKADFDTWAERQAALVKLGYDPGPVDGAFGGKTKAAVKAFQADQGLTPDGVWGAKTEYAMYEALKKVA